MVSSRAVSTSDDQLAEAISIPHVAAYVREVRVTGGVIRVRELGSGPTLLFVHGLLADGRVWNSTVAFLAESFHCVMPDLPLGAHRTPMDPDAVIDPERVARMLEDLTDAMDLNDVTVVALDSGGAITQFWMDAGAPRVGRVVLAPCDCFGHFLPAPFVLYQLVARVPTLLRSVLRLARLRWVRHSTIAYGSFTHRPIDDAVVRSWIAPAIENPAIARDAEKFLRGISSRRLTSAALRLGTFDRPVLLAWAPEQTWFPLTDAHRLAGILPTARVIEIQDSGAFIPLEQPAALAGAIVEFVN